MLKTNRSFINDYLKGYEHLFYLPEPYHEIEKSINKYTDKYQEDDLKTFAGRLDSEFPETLIIYRMQVMKKLRQIKRMLTFFTVVAVLLLILMVVSELMQLMESVI